MDECDICGTRQGGSCKSGGTIVQDKKLKATGNASYAVATPSTSKGKHLVRQRSVCMEDIRKREEKDALEKWTQIVQFCRIVSIRKLHVISVSDHQSLLFLRSLKLTPFEIFIWTYA